MALFSWRRRNLVASRPASSSGSSSGRAGGSSCRRPVSTRSAALRASPDIVPSPKSHSAASCATGDGSGAVDAAATKSSATPLLGVRNQSASRSTISGRRGGSLPVAWATGRPSFAANASPGLRQRGTTRRGRSRFRITRLSLPRETSSAAPLGRNRTHTEQLSNDLRDDRGDVREAADPVRKAHESS